MSLWIHYYDKTTHALKMSCTHIRQDIEGLYKSGDAAVWRIVDGVEGWFHPRVDAVKNVAKGVDTGAVVVDEGVDAVGQGLHRMLDAVDQAHGVDQ